MAKRYLRAMLVHVCIVLLIISCGEKTKRNMHSHAHPVASNMAPCIACGENRLSHTETGAENHCRIKIEPDSQAVLWQD